MTIGLIALASALALAAAQASPLASVPAQQRSWTVTVARDAITLRDVSRSGTPVETSPMRLEGTGVAVHARFAVENRARAHVVSIGATPSFSSFDLASPVERLHAPADRGSDLQARYEYRRYPFRDVLARGLDIGAGALAHAGRRVIERRVPPANDIHISDLDGGIGATLGVRLRRWDRVRLDAGIAGLLVMGRTRETHSVDPDGGRAQSGGGWLLETSASAGARVSSTLWLTGSYEGAGQIRLGSHRGHSERRARFAIGVTYVR